MIAEIQKRLPNFQYDPSPSASAYDLIYTCADSSISSLCDDVITRDGGPPIGANSEGEPFYDSLIQNDEHYVYSLHATKKNRIEMSIYKPRVPIRRSTRLAEKRISKAHDDTKWAYEESPWYLEDIRDLIFGNKKK